MTNNNGIKNNWRSWFFEKEPLDKHTKSRSYLPRASHPFWLALLVSGYSIYLTLPLRLWVAIVFLPISEQRAFVPLKDRLFKIILLDPFSNVVRISIRNEKNLITYIVFLFFFFFNLSVEILWLIIRDLSSNSCSICSSLQIFYALPYLYFFGKWQLDKSTKKSY